MSTPTTKRPVAPGHESKTPPSSSPSRAPRASTPGSSNTGERASSGSATPSVARTRSVRSSTLVSARAAAVQRRESLLGGSTSKISIETEEAVRAENLAILDDLKERLSKAESAAETYRRQNDVVQSRLDEAHREQLKLEERAHEYDEQLAALNNEKRDIARKMQQMETIYEAERSAMTREKEDMANREEEMQSVIQRLKDSLSQRATTFDDEGRPSRQSSNSPGVDSNSFAPPSSLHRSDSRNNSKLLLQKDKVIESLRLELAEAQIKLVESENQGGGRLREVERQLTEARMANARLMEDNESYQLLLEEKTLKGDFGTTELGYSSRSHSRPRSSNQDALNALEGRAGGASSLADELSGASEIDSDGENADGHPDAVRRLEAELKSSRDQNKALTLYINKIIERLLEHNEYEHILDKSADGKTAPSVNTNKELPSPPTSQQPTSHMAQTGALQSFLQRTKSMAVGPSTPVARTRPRPISVMTETALNHPDTAPSIPISLTRSTSVRRPMRPMSEQYTKSGTATASVFNAMYKGPDGPLSPVLRSSHFFSGSGNSGSNNPFSGQRSPGASTPGGPSGMASSGNFPGMKSETSSVSDESASGTGAGANSENTTTASLSSQSPPRHHEKTAFTGSKPRPLRLVQENPDSVKSDAGNKRASWIGWAFGKKEDASTSAIGPSSTTLPGGNTIPE